MTHPILSRIIGIGRLRRVHDQVRRASGRTFESRVLQTLDIKVGVRALDGACIPPDGPLIVAANHPTGALDGLALIEAVRQVRSDVRLLTNRLVANIPELRGSCFFVDPFGGAAAVSRSVAGLRAAYRWLRRGGALIMFPAGEVAWRSVERRRIESPWHPTVARLAAATRAAVLPVFLDGRNSTLFYLAGRLHPLLRTALLGRELLKKRGGVARLVLGAPIMPADLPSADAATTFIRRAIDDLSTMSAACAQAAAADVEGPVDPVLLAADVQAFPADAHLLASGDFDVYCARAGAVPNVLREIGRLRELTFRAVGEGTGRPADLDRFDALYDHLFVWNRRTCQVVGAYRIGPTDRLLSSHGLNGLYTRTLFRYDRRLLDRIGPALELGRSFVREEYQKRSSALFLLWRGIGELIARSPRYKVLFGCVSISRRYHETSQQLLRAFLARERLDESLAELVDAINPPPAILPPPRAAVAPASLEELDTLVARLENNHGLPVLLRQYLKLNAMLVGFNVDPAFGDALDALMMVDLATLPASILQRYLGRRGAALMPASRSDAAA